MKNNLVIDFEVLGFFLYFSFFLNKLLSETSFHFNYGALPLVQAQYFRIVTSWYKYFVCEICINVSLFVK